LAEEERQRQTTIGSRNTWGGDTACFGKPIEKQQQRVDLVVVAIRERKELVFEIGEPRSFVR
jgi:hypothetical protein